MVKTKQFLVIGAGRFGSALATTLYELGHDVVVVDRREERVEQIMDRVTHAVILDATDEEALAKLGLNTFDKVIVAIGNNLEASILSIVAAKNRGASYVISKATSEIAARVMLKVGADHVVRPEHDMGVRVAKALATPSIVDAFALGENYEVIEFQAQRNLCGKLKDLKLTDRFGVQVIAVNRHGELELNPGPDAVVSPGDNVVLIGETGAIERLREHFARVGTT
jgi:trk system potassium uptake protein TrkA